MVQPYSADLCERALQAYEGHEGSPKLLARRVQVSRACAYDGGRAARLEGGVARSGCFAAARSSSDTSLNIAP